MKDVPETLAGSRETVRGLFAAGLNAVDPARAVKAAIEVRGGDLLIGGRSFRPRAGVHIVAVGKAAVAMTSGALEACRGVPISGEVITKEGHVSLILPISLSVHEAAHPVPDARGVRATEQILHALRGLGDDATVMALISGGGSALLEAPIAGVTLAEFAETTSLLLRAGAPIEALNAVRSPLSKVKAGGLRRAAPAAAWATLVLSDVLGNDPRVIASGPTALCHADPRHALVIIDRYGLRELMPRAVIEALSREPSDFDEAPADADVMVVIGDNAAAVRAVETEAHARGLTVSTVWRDREGEARRLGEAFVAELATANDDVDVMLGGGEATVTVRGDGEGGRNTEFALAAAIALERHKIQDWVVASLATDGQDATTGLAGAIADVGTCQRARERGIDPRDALARNDSAAVFAAAGGDVTTGPTGTNVNDLYIAVRRRAAQTDGVGKETEHARSTRPGGGSDPVWSAAYVRAAGRHRHAVL